VVRERGGVMDPEIMEIMTCNEGMVLVSDLLLQRFTLACDNVNVIRSLREAGMGPHGQIVREIKAGFRFCSCELCS
jgi:hypothetical protein